jgi:two-component system sensor histidine kinase and response regulator WspE
VSDDLSGFSMMELFRMEADERLAALSSGLLALEGSTAGPEVIEPLMRAAHSLKGAARIVGLDAAVQVAHAMEDDFVAAQKGNLRLLPSHVDTLLRGVDLLGRMAQLEEGAVESWQVEHAEEIASLVEDLAAILSAPPDEASLAPAPVDDSEASEDEPILPTEPVAAEPEPSRASEPPPPSQSGIDVDAAGRRGTPQQASAETPSRSPGSAPTSRTGSSSPSASPSFSPGAGESPDRVVRVTADSLTRLMGLAGESLVQTRRLRPFVDALLRLKSQQSGILESLQRLEDRLAMDEIRRTGTHSEFSGGRSRSVLAAADRELLIKAKAGASQCLQELSERVEQFEDFARGSEDLSGRLHHEVLSSRMRPLAEGIRGFPRMVRDVSRQLGKEVRLVVDGDATGVDRDILDRLEAPLNHLIRNAIDHGLELPEQRVAAGKAATGTIRLEARHRAGMLQIILSDDGRGIDLEDLRRKVVEKGLTTADLAARLSEAELLDFLFLPGFSTRERVTELSGRGVGLDIVQSMVQEVRGTIRVSSRQGQGMKFTLLLPITVSVIRALLVEIGGEPFAFPLNRIDRILMLEGEEIRELEGKPFLLIDEQPVGLVEAARVLDLATTSSNPRADGRIPVVVVSDRSHRFGVAVDAFSGERDLRVSPLDARLGRVPNLSSSSVLENGWPVLIIDVEDLVRSIDNLLSGRRLKGLDARGTRGAAGEAADHVPRSAKRVLVVDDSITVRELERQLLESRGYHVDTAVDGVDGWNAVRTAHYDLVVSDVDMPRMNGIQLVENIKNDPRLKSIPVVIISYKDREEDRIRGLDAGANHYLTKSSFHDRTFLSTVVDLIGDA